MRLLVAVQVATVLQMWGTNVSLDLMDALKGEVALPSHVLLAYVLV